MCPLPSLPRSPQDLLTHCPTDLMSSLLLLLPLESSWPRVYTWVWGHAPECGQPASSHILNLSAFLSSPQLPWQGSPTSICMGFLHPPAVRQTGGLLSLWTTPLSECSWCHCLVSCGSRKKSTAARALLTLPCASSISCHPVGPGFCLPSLSARLSCIICAPPPLLLRKQHKAKVSSPQAGRVEWAELTQPLGSV